MKWCNWIQGNRFMENTVRPDRRGETEFDKQVATMRAWLLKKGWHKALAAMEFAKETHVGQRGGGEPEFSHQLFIAFYIITIEKLLMFPEETVCVAFLHDIHEDYDTSREELVRRFGEMVAASTITISKVRDGVRILDAQYYKEMEEDPIASVVKGRASLPKPQVPHPHADERHSASPRPRAGGRFSPRARDLINRVMSSGILPDT